MLPSVRCAPTSPEFPNSNDEKTTSGVSISKSITGAYYLIHARDSSEICSIMPRLSSRAANPAAGRACVNCQKRKTRCLRSGDTGPCSYCARRRKNCSFEGPPDRTPLTRKNLDASEHRCAQLGALLQSISPGLDIDTALQQFESEPSPTEGPAPAEINDSTPDSYEWHEGSLSPECRSPNWGTTMTTDGMATLSTTDSGYLGG